MRLSVRRFSGAPVRKLNPPVRYLHEHFLRGKATKKNTCLEKPEDRIGFSENGDR